MLLARFLSYSLSYWADKSNNATSVFFVFLTRLCVRRADYTEAAWGRKIKVYTPDSPAKQSRNDLLSLGKGRETRVLALGPNDVVVSTREQSCNSNTNP